MFNRLNFRLMFMMALVGIFISPLYAFQTLEPTPYIPVLHRPPLTVLGVKYSPDGQYIARVYANGRLEVLASATDKLVLSSTVMLPYPLLTAKIDWSPNGDHLAAGIGSQIYIWDIRKTQLLETIKMSDSERLLSYDDSRVFTPDGVISLQWDKTGTRLMAINLDFHYIVWSTEQHRFLDNLWRTPGTPLLMVWRADNYTFSSGDGVLFVQHDRFTQFRAKTLSKVNRFCLWYDAIRSNLDRTLVAWGTYNGCVVIVDPANGEQIAGYKIASNRNSIRDVAWSPDNSAIVAVNDIGTVQVVDLATGRVTLIGKVEGRLDAVDWSATNNEIAWGGITSWGDSAFATISVEKVKEMMVSNAAREPEFAITPPPGR